MFRPTRGLSIVMLAFGLLFAPAGGPPLHSEPGKTARVTMVPSASDVAVGSILTIRVDIENATDVASIPFRIRFDPQVLGFEAATEGPFLARAGRQTAFLAAMSSEGDEVMVGSTQLGQGKGVGGRGELCSLRFLVLGPGEAGLAFDRASVRDSLYQAIAATFMSSPVTAH